MKVKLALPVYQQLLAYAAETRMEFSGFGFCTIEPNKDIFVYDFALMDVGTEGYTEINPVKILPLMEREDRANMKVWIHRHPITGWSARDEQTILREPLGSTPEAVCWSVSIVLTPMGFIARIDNYLTGKTKVLEVEPNCTNFFQEIRKLRASRTSFHAKAFERRPAARDSGAFLQSDDEDGQYDDWEELEEFDEIESEELEEDELEPYEIDRAPETIYDIDTIQEVLAQLAGQSTGDPQTITLAEMCEELRIDWQSIREETRRNRGMR